MKKNIILFLIIISLGGLAAFQVHKRMNAPIAESIDDQQLKTGVPVRVYEVIRQDLEKSVSISGSIEAFKTVQIAPKITEYIETIHVTTGQPVKQGDLLVTMDATRSKLNKAQAEASLEQAEQNLTKLLNGARPEEIEGAQMRLDQSTALYELQKIELKRQENLFAEGASTEQALQNAENQTNSARSATGAARAQLELLKAGARAEDIELARIQVQLAQVAVDQAQQNLDNHYLHAPVDGQVTLRIFEQGDVCEANKTIFQVVQLDQVYLVLDVSELYLPTIAVGMEIAVQIDPLPGQHFLGQIAEINPVANEQTRSYITKIKLDNSKNQLKPGMFGRANFVIEEAINTFAVPDNAIKTDGQQEYVLVADDTVSTVTAPFGAKDFSNLYGFITQLKAGQDPLSRYIYENLSEDTQSKLTQNQNTDSVSKAVGNAVIENLNLILEDTIIFDNERFPDMALHEDDLALIENLKKQRKDSPLAKLTKELKKAMTDEIKNIKDDPETILLIQNLNQNIDAQNSINEKVRAINRLLLEKTYTESIAPSIGARRVNINTGRTFGNMLEISDGLDEGLKVITFSQDIVEPGTKVKITVETKVGK